MKLLHIIALALLSNPICESYHILGIFPFPLKGHMIMFEKIMKGLTEAGHTVDVVSHFPQSNPITRYNDLSVKGSIPTTNNIFDIKFLTTYYSNQNNVIDGMLSTFGIKMAEVILNTSTIQQLKSTKVKYDLIITEIFTVDCFLGFRHIFDIPVVSLTSSVDLPWGGTRIGNPDNPTYIPNYYSQFTSEMNLLDRIKNINQVFTAKYKYFQAQKYANKVAKSFFGSDLPDLEILGKQTNLMLVNSHFSISYARPTVPNFIEIGGIHIDSPKPLANRFTTIFKDEELFKGVIYISMGSLVAFETFDKSKLESFLEVLAKLPYKVLWKSKIENFPSGLNISTNVYFDSSWLPQLDVLCHPNLKLFISHGGLLGTQEAVYCGVPMIGIPFFADQKLNLKSLEKRGVALLMDYGSITKDSFQNLVTQILGNSKFEEKSKQLSLLFKDRPLSSLNTAIYWIEYVIRHNGALHLQSSGANLPWYQYYLLDIVGVFAMFGIIMIYLSYIILSYLVNFVTKVFYQKASVNKFKVH